MNKNVICLLWGTKYSVKFVNILYSMCKRNITGNFKFYCLTDEPQQSFIKGVIPLPIPNPQLDHWWNKMHLYNEALGIEGNILYIDLDTVIINNLDEFFTFAPENKFCVIKDFGQPTTTINSSVLRYNLKHHSHIWKTYLERKSSFDQFHGDQNVITELMRDHPQKVFIPDEWTYSFKWPTRGEPKQYQKYKPEEHPLKPKAKICVFHGHPNPDYAMQYQSGEWIKNYWKL